MKQSHFLLVVCFSMYASACDRLESISSGIRFKQKDIVVEDSESGLNQNNIEILTPKERLAVHKLFLTEIYEQIFARKLKDVDIYRSWLNILEQGASVEGIYRGLILSSEYRTLEKGVSTIEARKFFAQEMVFLEYWGKTDVNTHSEIDSINRKKMLSHIEKQIENISLFTIKRILGEKILEIVDKNKANKEKLASFYSAVTERWNKHGVNFGFSQRNSNDPNFHYFWAIKSSRSRIQWEMLNRMHRLMNFFGQILYEK